jgi:hypothetical protein
MIVEVKASVTKEGYELTQKLKAVVQVIQAQLQDGWQATQDLPPILTTAILNLAPAVDAITKIKEEVQANPLEFGRGIFLGASEMAEVFVKKAE